jgi:hypothetical protein
MNTIFVPGQDFLAHSCQDDFDDIARERCVVAKIDLLEGPRDFDPSALPPLVFPDEGEEFHLA